MTNLTPIGPLVLAGSGEYTPLMDLVDEYLVKVAGSRPVLLIATSCAQEGADVMTRWEQMGVAHFARLGVDATPLRICDKEDADLAENAERIAEAGVIWFSGGSPVYLAQSFYTTKSWTALEAANRRGAAVAGASGGLGVLNDHVTMPAMPPGPPPPGPPRTPAPPYDGPNALGLAAPVRAMAHFDRMESRRPEFPQRVVESLAPGQVAVGVDEDTGLVWTGSEWRAMGHKRAVVYDGQGGRRIFMPGDLVEGVPVPARAMPAPAAK